MVGEGQSDQAMTKPMSPQILVTESGDEIPSPELVSDEAHQLSVEVSADNKYACFNFSSRLAMYDFARSLLHEALYGRGGQKEFYPLEYQGKMEVIDGVRMSPDSSRVFIFYPNE
jgi:hypothetical protein